MEPNEELDRARRRRGWPIEVRHLADKGSDDLSESTTAQERLEMMWPLAVEAWRFANKPIPDYTRENVPSRVVRGYRLGGSPAD